MELVWVVPAAGIAAIFFAAWLAWDVLRRDTGSDAMMDIATMILEGANAFLTRQYRTIAISQFCDSTVSPRNTLVLHSSLLVKIF